MVEAPTTPDFDELAGHYDALIDWPRRLARETSMYRKLFEDRHVQRVVDLGCGTGHHAAMFHSWGLEVEAWDISSAMLDRCRRIHGEPDGLHWRERSFQDAPPEGGAFDAAVCVGNSLALAEDLPAVQASLRGMVRMVRSGGVGVIQVVNVWAMAEGPTAWQKVRRLDCGGEAQVLLKGLHRQGGRGFVDILRLRLGAGDVQWRSWNASFLGLRSGEVSSMLREAGADVLRVFGSHDEADFDERTSSDLIITWWRPMCG